MPAGPTKSPRTRTRSRPSSPCSTGTARCSSRNPRCGPPDSGSSTARGSSSAARWTASGSPRPKRCEPGEGSEPLLPLRVLCRLELLFLGLVLQLLLLLLLLSPEDEFPGPVSAPRPCAEGDGDHGSDEPDDRGGDDPARELHEHAPRDPGLGVHPGVGLGGRRVIKKKRTVPLSGEDGREHEVDALYGG